ncbi:MAG: hypothetical protein KC731_28560, partial [Myxococcales bacterium]|nr:hypothetical protein [Myxococcales bacterium]
QLIRETFAGRGSRMPTFTIVLDYRGGTYVSQVRARSAVAAVAAWARGLGEDGVPFIGPATAAQIATDLQDSDLVPLSGVVSVWATSFIARGKFALLNVIQTEERRSAR